MKGFSEKIFLIIEPPTEEDTRNYQRKIVQALETQGYVNVKMPLKVLQRLLLVCKNGDYHVTVTLVYREDDWIITAVEEGDTRDSHYGLAVDYGSTTIIMQLVNLNTGEVLAQAKEMNGQVKYGTDILTRITYTMEDMEIGTHMEDIQRATIETFDKLLICLAKETGIEAKNCPVLILSGNTTMIHFLLKLDAQTVFFSPYAPVTMNPGWFWGKELGMSFEGMVYIIPAASNYVGGDIVSGLLTMDFYRKDEIGLFFDIGTNGELVIGNKEWILAGAGAAGPALEGYISRYGVRAQDGAIDMISIQGEQLHFTTIGNKKPIGICGSGIIDLLAQMRLNGWINIAGELNPEASPRIIYHEEEEEYVAVYAMEDESATGELLYFSQTDIRQYIDTKAAAYTMIDCMLETAGRREEDIAHCYLSGAFSAHSNLESAITIGIFPDLPREKYTCIPNSSLDGARTLLLDRLRMADIHYLTEAMYCVQFASIPDFIIRMQAAKFIPHTDMRRYPTIEEKLNKEIF